MATYYIDYVNGNDGNDGLSTGQAWKTINQFTNNARSAGDIGKVRANQTHSLAADIAFTSNGIANSYITIKACTSTDDPWGDGSDVKPIIDFQDAAYQVKINRQYWKFQGFEVTGSDDTTGAVNFSYSRGAILQDCLIEQNGTAGTRYGLLITNDFPVLVKGCTFNTNRTANIRLSNAIIYLEDCVLSGGADSGSYTISDVGIRLESNSICKAKNTTLGVSSDHSEADLRFWEAGSFIGRNVKLDSATEVYAIDRPVRGAVIEDDEQTHLAFRAWYFQGNLSRTMAVNRSGEGGSSWSMLGEPSSNCGSEQALYVAGDWLKGLPIYLDGTEQTITVYAYADSTGGGWTPNASEFYIEIEHYEGAADWEIDVSTDTFAAEDQWESFAITLTPSAAGPAYLRAILKDYAAGGKIYIDPKPVIS